MDSADELPSETENTGGQSEISDTVQAGYLMRIDDKVRNNYLIPTLGAPKLTCE